MRDGRRQGFVCGLVIVFAVALAIAGCGGGKGSSNGTAGSSGSVLGAGGRGGFGILGASGSSAAGAVGSGGSVVAGAGGGGSGGSSKEGWVVLQDANNYVSISSLTIPVVQTASGGDLRVCWSGLAKDQFCHDLLPINDIDNIGFLKIPNLTHAQVAAKLAVGQLPDQTISRYADYHTDRSPTSTCANLSQFLLGTALIPATDYVEAANTTYLLLLTTGTTPGVGSRSMLFLQPMSTSSVSTVDAVDACAANALNFQATLGDSLPISRTDNTRWHLDWSQLTRDSFGNAVSFATIDYVQVGFYQNLTANDLEARLVDIDLIATSLYEVTVGVGATDVDLAGARLKGSNAAFPGFTQTDGVWSVAVRCSKCQIPQPVVFSMLQPE